jgi:hypothetical protein
VIVQPNYNGYLANGCISVTPDASYGRRPVEAESEMLDESRLDVDRIRGHFDFVARGRIVTNNAASTQAPRELMALYSSWFRNTRMSTAASPRHRRP